MNIGRNCTFKTLNFCYETLKRVRDLYSSGIDASNKEVYLPIGSVAYSLANISNNYYNKFRIYEQFKGLFSYETLSQDLWSIDYEIHTPPYGTHNNYWFYENKDAIRKREEYFSELNNFIESNLALYIERFEKIFDDLVLINAKPLAAVSLDDETVFAIKLIILRKIKELKVRNLNFDDYGKEFEICSHICLGDGSDSPVDLVNGKFGSIDKSRILEIISDYDLWDSLSIKISVNPDHEWVNRY